MFFTSKFLFAFLVTFFFSTSNSLKFMTEDKYLIDNIKDRLQFYATDPANETHAYIQEWLNKIPDAILWNFLEFHNFNLEMTEANLKETLEWRRVNKIDDIVNWKAPELLQQVLPYKFTGFNDEGKPVLYLPCGQWKLREASRKLDRRDILKHLVQMTEIVTQLMVKRIYANETENVAKYLSLVNLESLSLAEISSFKGIGTVITAFTLLERHYPFHFDRSTLVNVPALAKTLGDIIASSLSKQTLGRIKSYGKNEKNWLNEIQSMIPLRNIPTSLGGQFIE